jgi:hypothetical protein
MTSVERKAARYQRRKAAREAKRNDCLMQYDDFNQLIDTDNNIDHAVLFDMLERHITDRRVTALIRSFVSVFGPGKSLGLGSQISQVAAIFYPNTLDHVIKEKLRVKYYGRYMDDLYLIHANKEYLKCCLSEIKRVCQPLKLTVNEKKTRIVKLSRGMEFLKGKYILLESGRVLRRPGKDSARRMRRKLKKFKALINGGQMSFDDLRRRTSHGEAIAGGVLTPITRCDTWTGCITACS